MEQIAVMAEPVKERQYKRGERGLETMEKQMLQSTRMKRLIANLSEFYGVQFKTPRFIPVYITKRLKTNDGLHYTDKILIANTALVTTYYKRSLLWHEIMHSVVGDNWGILWEESKNQGKTLSSYQSFERQVFRFGINDGSHGSQNWKLLCECGMWSKTVKRKESWHCPRCKKLLVSKNEYVKLKKIAALKSVIKPTDINNYRPWKQNERIQ